jgi:hypothetical protein
MEGGGRYLVGALSVTGEVCNFFVHGGRACGTGYLHIIVGKWDAHVALRTPAFYHIAFRDLKLPHQSVGLHKRLHYYSCSTLIACMSGERSLRGENSRSGGCCVQRHILDGLGRSLHEVKFMIGLDAAVDEECRSSCGRSVRPLVQHEFFGIRC